jgi:hypothetical protein
MGIVVLHVLHVLFAVSMHSGDQQLWSRLVQDTRCTAGELLYLKLVVVAVLHKLIVLVVLLVTAMHSRGPAAAGVVLLRSSVLQLRLRSTLIVLGVAVLL